MNSLSCTKERLRRGLTRLGLSRIRGGGTPLPTEGRPSGRMEFMAPMPAARPRAPFFSSGPCAKRPGWTLDNLKDAPLGRSHRAKPGKARLKRAIDLTREVLEVPAGYRIG